MKQFLSAVHQIADEKGITEASVIETIEAAIAAAYKRDYGKKGQIIRAVLDRETGGISVTQTHIVVEGVDDEGYITGTIPEALLHDRLDAVDAQERRAQRAAGVVDEATTTTEDGVVRVKFNPEKHILLSEAREKRADVQVGEEIVERLEPKSDFGRIAAQTAKQVVIQRLREAERDAVFSEFKGKEGQLVSGVVQRREGPLVLVDIGRTTAVLPPMEHMATEHYRIGQRYRFIIVRVEESARGPVIVLSRAHPQLVAELFRVEVPEIEGGSVEIKGIAREAGSRSKIAVASHEEGVDPIGSLVGQKGVRVQTVIHDLGGEKIDIILWDADEAKFIANALSPAKVMSVELGTGEERTALVHVAEDQFSLAIGRRGQNVRLAAKLTGYRIDVRSPNETMTAQEAMAEGGETPGAGVSEAPTQDAPVQPESN